jgi:steroid delta-isomerase
MPMTMHDNDAAILHVYERWHQTVVGGDLDGLMALYADDAILETPLILATLQDKTEGILKGKSAIRPFFEAGFRKLRNDLAAGIGRGRSFRTAGN